MHTDGALTRADVVAALGRERSLTDGSAPWTLKFIELADRQFGGRWRQMSITGPDALSIVLPPHAGEPCRGDRLALIEPEGATVRDAARRLAAIRSEYEVENRSCWGRIAQATAAPFSTLVLTTAPLDDDDYRAIAPGAARLFHLDGFHRLVGWAWAGRLTPEVTIPVLVAGDPVAL